ncbi:radical SAM/SPASM domain-containing protein [Campylobacter fetus]|uniref:radical SAM/SPASM domain-containing protein n=2 Tax=Campylobacter fetus TaxID=196 RepID=UPI00138E3D41|nr:radical SAM/SPASM domain-containing protein [Campylobacter fetus]
MKIDNKDLDNKKEIIKNRFSLKNFNDYIKFPKYFEVETVNACNAHCKMCSIEHWEGYQDKNKFKRIMSDDTWSKFVQCITPYSKWIEKISLTKLGEPLLDFKIQDRIKDLKKLNIKNVSITTNASLLNEDISKKLLDSELDELNVSIDGLSKEVYEAIRIGLKHENVYKNTIKFINMRDGGGYHTSIRIRLTQQEQNLHEIADWTNFWKSKTDKNDKVYTMPLLTWGNRLFSETQSKIEFMSNKACSYLFSSMSIDYDGRVVLCCSDFNSIFDLGNINEKTINEIWTSKKYEKIREMHLNNKRNKINICKGCMIWDKSYTSNNTNKK